MFRFPEFFKVGIAESGESALHHMSVLLSLSPLSLSLSLSSLSLSV
jgi:hypothetical protein